MMDGASELSRYQAGSRKSPRHWGACEFQDKEKGYHGWRKEQARCFVGVFVEIRVGILVRVLVGALVELLMEICARLLVMLT